MLTTLIEYMWILYLLSALVLPMVITRKKQPVTAVAWIMAIIFLPIVGAVFYLIFGTERIVNKGRQKLFSNEALRTHLRLVEKNWAPITTSEIRKSLPEECENIRHVCRQLSFFDAIGHNQVDILVDAREIYQKKEEAIRNARKHINLEYYMFCADEAGAKFRDLLIEKAKQGVQVNLLYDAVGSRQMSWNRKFLKKFREAGIEPREFLPLRTFIKPWNMNLRNHRKILIVDNQIAFTGSINIGKDFLGQNRKSRKQRKWRETQVMIQGPAVAQLQWVFAEDWYFATGQQLLTPHYFHTVTEAGDDVVQTVASGPDVREEAIHKAFITAISQAKHSVYLTTPYFIPDQALMLALQLAARRGVDVEMLVPLKSDHPLVSYAGKSYYDELLQNKVTIYEYLPEYLHAKMLIVDSHFAVIGSANLDIRSFSYDFEINVQIYGETFAQKAEVIFFEDLKKSRKIDPQEYLQRPAYRRFGENICRLFSPLL